MKPTSSITAIFANKIIIVIILAVMVLAYLLLCTNLVYSKLEPVPIKMFRISSQYIQEDIPATLGNSLKQTNTTVKIWRSNNEISNIKLVINNPINVDSIQFNLGFKKFEQSFNFFVPDTSGFDILDTVAYNKFVKKTKPDLIFQSEFLYDNEDLIKSEIEYEKKIRIKNFLQRTQFDTWKCSYYYDNEWSMGFIKDIPCPSIKIDKISYEVTIPNGYLIDSENNYQLKKINGVTILSKELIPNEIFTLQLVNNKLTLLKNIFAFFGPLLIGTVLGMFLEKWLSKVF